MYPVVSDLKSSDYNYLKETELKQLVLFFKESEKDAAYVQKFEKAAEKRKQDQTIFFRASTENEYSKSFAAKFGFNEDDLPQLVAFKFTVPEEDAKDVNPSSSIEINEK